jgi:hypothetical protein
MVEATINQDALSSSARHKLKILLSPLAEELHQLFVNAKEIVIISPWIKSEALQEVLGCNRDQWPQIRALMSANLKDFLSGTSDIEVVKWLLEAEAELRSVTNLHAKHTIENKSRTPCTLTRRTEQSSVQKRF